MKIAIITSFPRAARVEVFNELAKQKNFKFKVFYLRQMPEGRYWDSLPKINHDHLFIKETVIKPHLYINYNFFKFFKPSDFDLVVITQYASITMQLAMYFCSFKRVPFVFWSERPAVKHESYFTKSEILRKFFRLIAIFPIKMFSKQIWGVGNVALIEYKNLLGKKLEYRKLNYFSDLSNFKSINRNINSNIPVILFSGTLGKRKAFDTFCKTVVNFFEKGGKAKFLIAGNGPWKYMIDNLVKRFQGKVEYIGFVQLNKLKWLYASADILFFPTRHDGWGMTLPEAMSSGLAIVTSNNSGFIIENKNKIIYNFVCEVDDIEEYVKGLLNLTSSIVLLKNAQKESQQISSLYDVENGVKAFIERFREIQGLSR